MTDLPPTPPAQIAKLNAQPLTVRAADGYQLRGELTLPANAKAGQKFPVVILLHGSGPNDMNETMPEQVAGVKGGSATFLDITRRLNAAGYAVFRYNKRGVKDVGPVRLPPEQFGPPEKHTVSAYTRDALDVLNAVRKLPQVDAGQVFLLGHSEGTLVASKLAGQYPQNVRGLILIGTVGDSFRDTLHFQMVTRPLEQLQSMFDSNKDGFLTVQELTDTAAKLGLDLAEQADGLGLERKGDKWAFLPEMKPDAQGRVSISGALNARLEQAFSSYPNLPDFPPSAATYFKDADAFGTVTSLLPTYKGPVLMLQGADDPQTTLVAAQKAFAAAHAAGNTQIQMNVYAGYGHTLAPADKNGLPTLGPIAQGPLNDMATWLGTVTGK